MEELKLQKHGNFTDAEKIGILKALDACEDEYKSIGTNRNIILFGQVPTYGNTFGAIGLCNKLKYRLTDYTYKKLHDLYHNPKFYAANDLQVHYETANNYWWSRYDTESRLKAIELLRKAIKND